MVDTELVIGVYVCAVSGYAEGGYVGKKYWNWTGTEGLCMNSDHEFMISPGLCCQFESPWPQDLERPDVLKWESGCSSPWGNQAGS